MIYCYSTEDGEIHERFFHMGKAPKEIEVDGKKAKRSYVAESKTVPASAGWPMECMASGVHASQAKQLESHLRDRGVPTRVSRDGNPIYTDKAHRNKALKARGFHDRNAYT